MPLTPYPSDIDLNRQAVEIPFTRKDGQTSVYKSALWDRSRLMIPEEPQTTFELFEQSVARHPDRDMFARIPIISPAASQPSGVPVYGTNMIGTTYRAVQERRDVVGSALLGLERGGRLRSPSVPSSQPSPTEVTHPGVPHFGAHNRVKNGARRGWAVGLWSKNREEWQVVDLACQAYGLVSVSLYETLGPDVAQYITNHCPLSIIFASSNHIAEILKIVPSCPSLRVIVCMDPLARAERDVLMQWAQSVQVELIDMLELERWGGEQGIRCNPGPVKGVSGEDDLDRDRIVTISYTSGTTGNPKGVVLTNQNFTTAAISQSLGVPPEVTKGQDQPFRYLSFLPLSHIFERFMELVIILGDGTICFTTGDVTRLLDDAQVIKPHSMIGVPRIWNRIHAAVKAQMAMPGLKGALLRRAVATKLEIWRTTGEVNHTAYDLLVFRKIRNLLGGSLVQIISGAAPLSPEVHELLKICFSCSAVQGYGMTETVGTCTKGAGFDIGAVGTIGAPQPCNDIMLVDVGEMGYTSNDTPNPRGELCLKGCNITPGYLHDPENTAKTIDGDGWLHTGDIVELDPAGRLKIVDRIKNVVKLSQGEYVALEKLEGMYALEPVFASLLVHGDSTRSYLIALGVLDPVQASGLVSKVLGQPVAASDLASLDKAVKDKRVRQAVLQNLAKIAKQNKLNGFEQIKGVHLTLVPFPQDILTPTLKVKRNVAAKLFKKEIDALYEETDDLSGELKIAAKL